MPTPKIKPLLVIVAGPNGSGKTTITQILRENYAWTQGLLEINPDNIAQQEFGDWNNPASVKQAADKADMLREECLRQPKPLTVFRTVDGAVDKTYVTAGQFPEWTKAIYQELSR